MTEQLPLFDAIRDPQPARPDEVADIFVLMRVALLAIVAEQGPLHLTQAAREKLIPDGAVLRGRLDADGTITFWLAKAPPEGRSGVAYVEGDPR